MTTGAFIERGRICAVMEDGYTVASLDREGIETPPIKDMGEQMYTVGDTVYFFLFPDGTGKVLCGM